MARQHVNLSHSRCSAIFTMPMHGVATRKSDISHVEGFPGT